MNDGKASSAERFRATVEPRLGCSKGSGSRLLLAGEHGKVVLPVH